MNSSLQSSPTAAPPGPPSKARTRPGDERDASGFFAIPMHFDRLAIRAHAAASRRVLLRAWCANSGKGEDAYSVAMMLREAGCVGEVLATDPSPEAVAVGRRGMYPMNGLAGLGGERVQRHFFVRGADGAPDVTLVRGELRAMVAFSCLDVFAAAWPVAGRFDVIFCRRGLGDADTPARRLVISRLVAALATGGTLFLDPGGDAHGAHPGLRAFGDGAYERVGDVG